MKLNPASPRQKQHYTGQLFDERLGIKFQEETSNVLNLDHISVW
jgi:hypothetical protein